MAEHASDENPRITLLGEPLEHPEGPDTFADGGVVFVETWTGKVKLYREERGITDYAMTHGGPNACAIGADGCVYVTQNGGRWRRWVAERPACPGIQRITPEGRVETIIDSVDGIACGAPNDLCFGADGRLYFTDPVGWPGNGNRRPRHVFAVAPGGKGEVIAELGDVFPNGIAADREGGVVWGETTSRLIKRKRPGTAPEILVQLPEGHMPDGMKFDARGRLWIATVTSGGFDVLDLERRTVCYVPCGHSPLNCVFVGDALVVTDRGLGEDAMGVARSGRLIRFDIGVAGQELFRGHL